MKPRLTSSKKWTAFPKEFSEQIQAVFKENFSKELKSAQVIVEGRIYPEEILVRIGLLEAGRLRQMNFEISVDYSPLKNDAVARINDSVDIAASLMADYFEQQQSSDDEEELDLPLSWKEINFNGQKIFVQFSTVNTELEAAADAILGTRDPSLVKSEESLNEDESEQNVEDFDDDDSEDEGSEDSESADDVGPKMFGPGPKKKPPIH